MPFDEQKTDGPQIDTGDRLEVPPHLHRDVELLYVQAGWIEARVGDDVCCAGRGSLLLAAPDTVHAYHMLTPPGQTRYMVAIGSPALAGDGCARLCSSQPVSPLVPAAELHPDAAYALDALQRGGDAEDPMVRGLFFQLILSRICPRMEWKSDDRARAQSLEVRVIAYISEHFREPLSLDILAAACGVGRCSLSRLFSSVIGTSFCAYLHGLRIHYAETLLRNTSRDISGIGPDCGFENQQTFNRVFKSYNGLTPREYRRAALELKRDESQTPERPGRLSFQMPV